MNITYTDTKEIVAYRDFVCTPTCRDAQRAFRKYFPPSIEKAAVKLHRRLSVEFANAGAYNRVYGRTENRIELIEGQRDKEDLILKTRVNDSYRKFFNAFMTEENPGVLAVGAWQGQFDIVTDIHVVDVNNHDYKRV